jgi:hypothetical protein
MNVLDIPRNAVICQDVLFVPMEALVEPSEDLDLLVITEALDPLRTRFHQLVAHPHVRQESRFLQHNRVRLEFNLQQYQKVTMHTQTNDNNQHSDQVKDLLFRSFEEIVRCNQLITNGPRSCGDLDKDDLTRKVLFAFQVKRFSSCRCLDETRTEKMISKAVTASLPIPVTIVCGPLKNRRLKTSQSPDWAEFFQYVQLTRFHRSILEIYPPGLQVKLLLDDARAEYANKVPRDVFLQYKEGVQTLLESLSLGSWLQASSLFPIYDDLEVTRYLPIAQAEVHNIFDTSTDQELADVTRNAWENNDDNTDAQEAVRRYLIAQKAETLAGLWDYDESIFLRYGRAPLSLQRLWSVRKGSSDLPWQGIGGIALFQDGEYRPCVWQQYRSCSLRPLAAIPVSHTAVLPSTIPLFQVLCDQNSETPCETCPIASM